MKIIAHEERKKARRMEVTRRVKYQWFVFITAFIKFYILSACVYTSITYTNVQNPGQSIYKDFASNFTDYAIWEAHEQTEDNYTKILTLCLAILLMGNIMDNVKGLERKVVFYFDLAMSFSFLIWALSFSLWKEAFINFRKSHPDEIPP